MGSESNVFQAIAPVKVKYLHGKCISTHAFIDNGSSSSLIMEQQQKELHLSSITLEHHYDCTQLREPIQYSCPGQLRIINNLEFSDLHGINTFQ